MSHLTIGTATTIAALVALAGCSGGAPATGQAPTTAPPPASSTPGAEATTAPEDPSAASASPTASDAQTTAHQPTPPTDQPPVASRTTTSHGFRLALDLYPLQRSGSTVTMNARLRVLATPPDPGANADQVLAGSGANDGLMGRTNGFSLIDRAGGRLYPPAQADGSDLCAPTFHGGWRAGDELWVTCLFGAPPASSTTVSVRAATFGTFEKVPVSHE